MLANQQTVLAAEDNSGQKLLPTESLRSAISWGIVNLFSDADNVVRRARLNDSFSAEILKKYYSATGGSGLIPTGNIFINYAGGTGYFPMYSLVDILEGMSFPNFAGKIVLIGATAPDLHDEVLTPVSHGKSMAGVEVHANILDTVLTGKYLKQESRIVTGLQISVLVLIISAVWGAKGNKAGVGIVSCCSYRICVIGLPVL